MSGMVERAFLDDIVANIDDDTPRLVYADWLMENDREDRGEFIRVQVERARLPAWDPAQVRLRLREEELLKRHGEEWLAELPDIKGASWEGFRRGIVAEVAFESFEAMRANAHACRAVAPVEAVTVHWPEEEEDDDDSSPIAELRELTLTGRPWFPDQVARVADSPQLSTLRVLTTLGLSAEDLGQLIASPHLTGLRALRLRSSGLGTAGVRTLTESGTLKALEDLDLSGASGYEHYYEDPMIGTAGMQLLADWPGLARVRSLTLSGNDVHREGLQALLRSPHVGALRNLSLRYSRLNGQAVAGFGDARPDLRLETLDIGMNVLRQRGAEHLASVPCLSELKSLRLDRCEIPLSGARYLATQAAFLDGLRLLDVGYNHFGSVGLADLLERKPPSLHTLLMRDNDLYDKGAELLAGAPASDNLLEVDLSKNDLGAAAAVALGESKHLRKLLILRLLDNPISKSAAAILTASPLGKRLAVLELKD